MIKSKNSKVIYKKLIITYVAVILGIVFILESYFIMSIRKEKRNRELEYNQSMCQKAADYIDEIATVASDIQYGLYQNKTQIQDVVWFLNLDLEGYFRKKFEEYSQDSGVVYQGIDYFTKDAFRYSKNMISITFVSFASNKMYTYYPNGDIKTDVYGYDSKLDKDFNIQVDNESITFLKEIYDPNTFQEVGSLKISFNNKGLSDLEGKFLESKLIVYADNGDIAYCNENIEWVDDFRKYGENTTTILEKKYNVSVDKVRTRELNIVAYLRKEQTGKIPLIVWMMLILMGIGLFSIGIYFVNRRIRHLSNRLELILNGMKRVMEGDLTVRLDVKKEDELDIIADNFNIMCANLDTYIKKSYLAEIEQKNAEMSALQSQINPHFLYNTLEAIRMKAICNGDKEVGKMLYGLAVVFRSQVKDENVVNIARELYYCKKYLELFEFRYQDKFQFVINCEEKYMEIPVIKFIVQPIVENYFVHGIRLKEKDNYLEIVVREEGNGILEENNTTDKKILLIEVKDNGVGMTEEQMNTKNMELKEKINIEGSIGILNVHRRLCAAYGEEYGVILEKNKGQGLFVTLRIPVRKGENKNV